MIERCIAANFDVLALTVDTITGGNRNATRMVHLAPALDAQKPPQLRHASEVGG